MCRKVPDGSNNTNFSTAVIILYVMISISAKFGCNWLMNMHSAVVQCTAFTSLTTGKHYRAAVNNSSVQLMLKHCFLLIC